jgi:hypothetical protein
MPAATAAKAPRPRAVLMWTAMEPEAPLPDSRACTWTPNVVPERVCTEPSLAVTVVVMVAGRGESVVDEQPDHVPVQLLNGPQPAVQVVC